MEQEMYLLGDTIYRSHSLALTTRRSIPVKHLPPVRNVKVFSSKPLETYANGVRLYTKDTKNWYFDPDEIPEDGLDLGNFLMKRIYDGTVFEAEPECSDP